MATFPSTHDKMTKLSNVQRGFYGSAQSSGNVCVTNNTISLAIKWNHAFYFFLTFFKALATLFRDTERTQLASPNLAVTDAWCVLGLSGFSHCYGWHFRVPGNPVVPGIGEGCLPSEVSWVTARLNYFLSGLLLTPDLSSLFTSVYTPKSTKPQTKSEPHLILIRWEEPFHFRSGAGIFTTAIGVERDLAGLKHKKSCIRQSKISPSFEKYVSVGGLFLSLGS